MNQLVGKIAGQHAGPILVVGGAPSVPAELQKLRDGGFDFERCTIISANEHAIHAGLKPHYCCANDDVHSTLNVHQEPRLRRLMPGIKLLSRHWWADYRSPQLLACNSGLKAILYAAILGANPVVVIGIQHYEDGLYFHPDNSRKKNPNLDRGEGYFRKQTNRLQEMLRGVPVRPVSGPLTKLWPAWYAHEEFAPREQNEMERKAVADAATQKYVCATLAGVAFESALVAEGAVFAVTEREWRQIANPQAVVEVAEPTHAAAAEAQALARAEHSRLIGLVGRVRKGGRIRRGIYDADILRIIKRLEAGQSPDAIAKRVSLPADQIRTVARLAGVDTAPGL